MLQAVDWVREEGRQGSELLPYHLIEMIKTAACKHLAKWERQRKQAVKRGKRV